MKYRVDIHANGRCPVMRDGIPTYLDHNHLSVSAVRHTAPIDDRLFDNDGQRAPTP